MEKITILIPVFNEKNSLLELLKKVEELDFNLEKEIILIDDFSTDGTKELYEKTINLDMKSDAEAEELLSKERERSCPKNCDIK